MVRFKHRYLLVHLVFPAHLSSSLSYPLPPSSSSSANSAAPPPAAPAPPSLSESAIIGLLRDSLAVNFGDVGAGEVGGTFSVKYLSPSTSTLIIRVSREHYRTLWAALTLLRRIGGEEVVARVVHVSGTIRKTQHAAISHDRTQILLSAKRQRLLHRRSALSRSQPVSSSAPGPAAVLLEAAASVATAEETEEVEEKLRKSEEEIMALEA
ncbi:hypothetical protein JCM8547_008172 [Rhodosporidiobolus lusitaniae]